MVSHCLKQTRLLFWFLAALWLLVIENNSLSVTLTADQKLSKLEIEHKSLILAQIERWRHALHMQVGRQHEYLYLVASGERVSNILERTE